MQQSTGSGTCLWLNISRQVAESQSGKLYHRRLLLLLPLLLCCSFLHPLSELLMTSRNAAATSRACQKRWAPMCVCWRKLLPMLTQFKHRNTTTSKSTMATFNNIRRMNTNNRHFKEISFKFIFHCQVMNYDSLRRNKYSISRLCLTWTDWDCEKEVIDSI